MLTQSTDKRGTAVEANMGESEKNSFAYEDS